MSVTAEQASSPAPAADADAAAAAAAAAAGPATDEPDLYTITPPPGSVVGQHLQVAAGKLLITIKVPSGWTEGQTLRLTVRDPPVAEQRPAVRDSPIAHPPAAAAAAPAAVSRPPSKHKQPANGSSSSSSSGSTAKAVAAAALQPSSSAAASARPSPIAKPGKAKPSGGELLAAARVLVALDVGAGGAVLVSARAVAGRGHAAAASSAKKLKAAAAASASSAASTTASAASAAASAAASPGDADAVADADGGAARVYECGLCEACLDKVKFGGPGKLRKACYKRPGKPRPRPGAHHGANASASGQRPSKEARTADFRPGGAWSERGPAAPRDSAPCYPSGLRSYALPVGGHGPPMMRLQASGSSFLEGHTFDEIKSMCAA